MAEKKAKKKRVKRYLGVKEFIFNFVSLVFMIGVGVYFGYRSLYYYSKQTQKLKEESQTLNGFIIQNNPVVGGDADGLHHDSKGYYFKGILENNYVSFANRLFRIIRVNEDNTVKLISADYVAIFPWGNESTYKDSNVYQWLNPTDSSVSGVYYKTFPKADKFLEKMKYTNDIVSNDKTTPGKDTFNNYFSLLNPSDYILAGGKNSFLNNGKLFFLQGLSDKDSNIYVDEDGSIQQCDSTDGYGIRPVITLKANTVVSTGDGTSTNPYMVFQGKDTNYVYSYFKLGDDIWQAYYQDSDAIHLSYNGYIGANGVEFTIPYGQYTSFYDIMDKSGVGYFLNNDYYLTLPYQESLLEFTSHAGEISDDKGYQYSNIYNGFVVSKVGLLNIFDPMVNSSLEDYFRCNTISEVGSMVYTTNKEGQLLEADIGEWKHIVPTISISIKNKISGSGTLANPYTLG